MTWDHFAFDRMDVFKKIYRHQSSVFLRQWTSFGQNMGMRASIFRENRKEMASYKLFWPIIFCSFDRIDVFNQIWAWLHEVLDEKNLNNDMRAPCFLNFTFFDQIWAWQKGVSNYYIGKSTWEHGVFERMDFFWQNMGTKALCF